MSFGKGIIFYIIICWCKHNNNGENIKRKLNNTSEYYLFGDKNI